MRGKAKRDGRLKSIENFIRLWTKAHLVMS